MVGKRFCRFHFLSKQKWSTAMTNCYLIENPLHRNKFNLYVLAFLSCQAAWHNWSIPMILPAVSQNNVKCPNIYFFASRSLAFISHQLFNLNYLSKICIKRFQKKGCSLKRLRSDWPNIDNTLKICDSFSRSNISVGKKARKSGGIKN